MTSGCRQAACSLSAGCCSPPALPTQLRYLRDELGWQLGGEMEMLTGDRMVEAQRRRVQEQALGDDGLASPAQKIADVDGFTHQGMPLLGEMNANLMGSAGLQAHPTQAGAAEMFRHLDQGNGVLTFTMRLAALAMAPAIRWWVGPFAAAP